MTAVVASSTRAPASSPLCVVRHGIMSPIMRLLIVLVLALPFAASSAVTLTGRTVRVTGGDTVVILSEGNANSQAGKLPI